MSKRRNRKRHNANNQQVKQEIDERKRQMAIAYYKLNPVIFFERELGVTLTGWQKFLLNRLFGEIK
jgi:hypothetical protein